MLCLVAQSCPTLCDPMDYSPAGSSVYGDSPGKNTGVGCHALLQGIFPTQGSNPGLMHCRQILYCLSHQGNPLVPQSGIEPTRLALEGKVLATGPPGKSLLIAFCAGDVIIVSVHVLQKQMEGQS